MLVTNSQYAVNDEFCKEKKISFMGKLSRAIDYAMKMRSIAQVGINGGDMKPQSAALTACVEQIKNENL